MTELSLSLSLHVCVCVCVCLGSVRELMATQITK